MYRPGPIRGETFTARVSGVDHIHLQISLPRCIAGNGYLRESTPVIANYVIGKTLYEAHGKYCADHRRTRGVVIDGDIAPISNRALTELPALMLNFDRKKQKELAAFLKARPGASKQGDKNVR